jgi:hypothetical protein
MKNLFFIVIAISIIAKAEVKPEMQNFFFLVDKIQKFTLDKSEYIKKSNEKEIAAALKQFNETVARIKSEKMSGKDDMKFRLQLLKEGLEEAEQAFNTSFKDYSHWALKASLNQCYSCHTQKSLTSTGYTPANFKNKTDYAKAEFLFLVRNYSQSIPLFEKVVLDYPRKVSVEELESAIQKILYHAIRVQKNDSETLTQIDRLLNNKLLPSSVKNDFSAWKKYLNVKKYNVSERESLTTPAQLQDYITSRNDLAANYRLSNQRYVVDLDTNQRLYQLLESNSDVKMKPWILYWLAYQEKDYQQSMFDQSAEMYLRECIEKYTRSEAAKKCFSLYKEIITDSFTGSRGTEIPEAFEKQIDNYKKMIDGGL